MMVACIVVVPSAPIVHIGTYFIYITYLVTKIFFGSRLALIQIEIEYTFEMTLLHHSTSHNSINMKTDPKVTGQ